MQPVTNTSKFTAKIKNKHQKWTQLQHDFTTLHCSSPYEPQCAESTEDHATLL